MTATSKKAVTITIGAIGVILLIVATFFVYSLLNTQPQANGIELKEYPAPTTTNLLEAVNEEREARGIKPLTANANLTASAQLKAEDMFNNDYFDHVDPNGKHGWEYAAALTQAECKTSSENISWTRDEHSTRAIMEGWMNSPAHKAAILNPEYTLTGFGISGDKIVEHFCIAK